MKYYNLVCVVQVTTAHTIKVVIVTSFPLCVSEVTMCSHDSGRLLNMIVTCILLKRSYDLNQIAHLRSIS